MEILQLPLQELETRIESELQSNPVLELTADDAEQSGTVDVAPEMEAQGEDRTEAERPLLVKEDSNQAADFERLNRLADYLENEEFATNSPRDYRVSSSGHGERDKKLDAMTNTAARPEPLSDYLLRQWQFVECPPPVFEAGQALIEYIDADGYLRTDLEVIAREWKTPLKIEDLQAALKLLQGLEPSGVGARTLRECLLIQLEALEEDPELSEDHDFDLERLLVRDHLKDLEMNRYPQISRKLERPIEDIQAGVKGLSKLNPRPGRSIGADESPQITPDAIIFLNEETGQYEVTLTRQTTPNLYISAMYRKMLKERGTDKKTKQFLAENVRNAKWLIEAIEQRGSTILRVIRTVVAHQKEFFDKGPEHLKPLPMIQVADELGIHVATVSRAVSEKWLQTPRGILPLRRFFSLGTTSAGGEDMSWDAVKEKLRVVIAEEDKKNPLNDDEIVLKMQEQGITLARRTVAKYRKILNIAPARQRREF